MTFTSAVIDKRSADALISLAAKERLVWAKRPTDGVFERICQADYSPRIQEQLLEQLVLTPKLSLCGYSDYLWDALEGPLKEEGHLANLAPLGSVELTPKVLPLDTVSGLVGRNISKQEMEDLLTRVNMALSEESEYERRTGKTAPNLYEIDIRSMFNKAGLMIPSEYTEQEIAEQRRRNVVYSDFSPIAAAIQEYVMLASVAEKYELLVKTPILQGRASTSFLNPKYEPNAADAELVLFRIVAQELGRTTFRPSLAGSLVLASEPATASLRDMLSIWYSRLASGDTEELRRIQSEINTASAALKKLSGVRTLGTITTLLAVPISIAELILQLPPVLGISVSSVGVFANRREASTLAAYRWATYGGT
jgi:hypothetical protein